MVQEYETIFRMWPFPQSTVAEIEPPPASQSNQDRVAEADKEFSAANGEYLEACLVVDRYCRTHRTPPQFFLLNDHVMVPVNANDRADPELQKLESIKRQALVKRNARMRWRADMRQAAGLIR